MSDLRVLSIVTALLVITAAGVVFFVWQSRPQSPPRAASARFEIVSDDELANGDRAVVLKDTPHGVCFVYVRRRGGYAVTSLERVWC